MSRIADTRENIIAAAIDLIWQNSYGTISVDEICLRAGAKKGSFYHYFGSKSDLMVEAMESLWERKRAILDQVFSVQHNPLERFERYCKIGLELQADRLKELGHVCGCPFFSVASEMSSQDEKVRIKAVEIMEKVCRYFESALRDLNEAGLIPKMPTQQLAREIFSFVTGKLLQSRVENSLEPLTTVYDGILRLIQFKDGLAAHSSLASFPMAANA